MMSCSSMFLYNESSLLNIHQKLYCFLSSFLFTPSFLIPLTFTLGRVFITLRGPFRNHNSSLLSVFIYGSFSILISCTFSSLSLSNTACMTRFIIAFSYLRKVVTSLITQDLRNRDQYRVQPFFYSFILVLFHTFQMWIFNKVTFFTV